MTAYGYDSPRRRRIRVWRDLRRHCAAKARRLLPVVVALLAVGAYAIVSDHAPGLRLPVPCPSLIQPCGNGPWTY